MTGRILIIVSYNGYRHETIISPAAMLQKQAAQFQSLHHGLDKIVIVATEYRPPGYLGDPEYEEALKLFPHVMRVENGNQGSYGAWRDAFLANSDFEWYFFLEDDYTFVLDDFDQIMIDRWTPETSYLAHKIDVGGQFGIHTAMSSGLTRGDILRGIDWTEFNKLQGGEYSSGIQIGWSDLFATKGLRDITEWYGIKFFVQRGSYKIWNPERPYLILPLQDI